MHANKPVRRTTSTGEQLRVKIDAELFDPATLHDEIALENTLCILGGHFQNPAVDQESLLRDLLSIPNLFAFVLAGLDNGVANSIADNILALFPEKAADFDDAVASRLLTDLSRYFWDLNFPAERLRECHDGVNLISPALRVLATKDFGDEAQSPSLDEDGFDGFVIKQAKQKAKKNAKRATRAVVVDSKTFDRLGVDVPRSQREAEQLGNDLLDQLKTILTVYLQALREPALLNTWKKTYIGDPSTDNIDIQEVKKGDTDGGIEDLSESASGTPSAFPLIQPMYAALYFESVTGFGEWRILMSRRATKDLRNARRSDKKLFGIILKKLKELSIGHFSDDNQKRLSGSDNAVPIYEAKMTRDTRLVYQVDCIQEFEENFERQVLRIFGVYTHAQLGRNFWTAMSLNVFGKGKTYKQRCQYRKKPKVAGDKVFAPGLFSLTGDAIDSLSPAKLPDLHLSDEEQIELHSLRVLETFVIFSQPLLDSIYADQDVTHPFHLSPAEQDIVKHSGSCFVIGRSGTGKTITMLYKIFHNEKKFNDFRSGCEVDLVPPRPRQLFVTQSRLLAEKVEEYYSKLAMSLYAARRTEEGSTTQATRQKAREGLVDRDEEELHCGTLPKSFSELRDEHFPLFITFDQLCRLLEGDLQRLGAYAGYLPALQDDTDEDGLPAITSDDMLRRRDSFVSYDMFLEQYWPHLPRSLTKSFDPALVFAEFIGVIKGSEDSLQSDTGFLSREQYLAVGHRQQSTFASRRDPVYTLFLAYLKLKRERRHWDAADRTHAILGGLRRVGVQGTKLDLIYVDEAQDNLLIDTPVVRALCKNPNGLFWAGDTAQTISAGSSFRFNDLKAFTYRLDALSPRSSTNSPKSFQLTVNYRSHGGIANCAHSVVQLITTFWPHAIDSLSEERGLVDGIRPVFFSNCEQDSVHYEQFLLGASGDQAGFGHQQCILVRDDAARERLRGQVGDIGNVLTLYESKGLEFNDVLLLNFFEDSAVDVAQWRVILNALLPEMDLECPQTEGGINPVMDLRCPQFDDLRHNGVCRELKFLYVAITRARKNLWIVDCSNKGEPLRTYWNHRNLINNVSAADNIPRLATESTCEEWAETAEMFFHIKRYPQAMRCYERANMPRERDAARSFSLRQQARAKPTGRGNSRQAAFLEAAQAFSASAFVAVVEKLSYYRIAAECYLEASDLVKAARAYISAEEYTQAAQVYRRAGLFDEAVETLEKYKDHVEDAEAAKILDVAKLHYCNRQDFDRATRLFSEVDSALDFMEKYEFSVARVTLLERNGRFAEAAEIHLEEGRITQAIRMFLRDASSASQSRAELSLLRGLWREISFGVPLASGKNTARSRLASLLASAAEVQSRFRLSAHTLNEIDMFRAIFEGDRASLRGLGQKFAANHPEAATLCLDFAFRDGAKFSAESPNDALGTLQAFNTYVREFSKFFFANTPCHNPSAQKLFGFRPHPDSENIFNIRPGTFLHVYMSQLARAPASATQSNGYTVNAWDLNNHLESALRQRLKQKVQDEDSECMVALPFQVCPVPAVFGSCIAKSERQCSGSHDRGAFNVESFQRRVRIILQQILVYQTMSSLDGHHALAKQRRFWLSKLYTALFPVHVLAGSLIDIDITSLPESEKALQVAKEWIREFFYYKSSWTVFERQNFLTSIAEMATLALMLDKEGAQTYFGQAPCISIDRPPEFLRVGGRYIVHDLLHYLCRNGNTAVSAGVLFIETVCKKRLPMDSSFICNMIEQMCAAYAIAYRLRRQGFLHDLTLGWRWMMRLHANQSLKDESEQFLFQFVEVLRPLLWEMYSGESAFLLHNGSGRIEKQVRRIFVSRICKSFTLLGYNIPSPQLRANIQRNISSLKRPDVHYSWIFQRYVNASTWLDLVKALRVTGMNETGTAEELVRLLRTDRVVGTVRHIRGIRSIVYKQATDIPALLRGEMATTSSLIPHAPAFVPMRALPPPANIEADIVLSAIEEAELGLEAPPDEENTGVDDAVDLIAATQAVDESREEQTMTPPTPEEINAAKQILTCYRRIRSRRRGSSKKGLEPERNRWYLACRERAQEMGQRYKLLYLGPLPLVLVSLDILNRNMLASKKDAMLRNGLAQHLEYEAIMEKTDRAMAILKRIKRLKDLLKPDSALHQRESEEELRTHVKEVQDLVEELPAAFTAATSWDIQTAVKGIVQKRGPPKKAPKPELVVDIDELEYY